MQIAVKRVWARYAQISGRATRPEFWWWALFVLVMLAAARTIDVTLVVPLLGWDTGGALIRRPLTALAVLILALPYIAVAIRRAHDSNRRGWWVFLALVPVIGPVVLIYVMMQPSDVGRNGYGDEDPLPEYR